MRKLRIVEPGFPHHFILRGNNRRLLFSYKPDYQRFLGYLTKATLEHDVALHDYCLMSNHIHLLATPDNVGAASNWVKSFAQPYAQRRNKARDGSGKLFEQRFWARPITDLRYLANCTRYIQENPTRSSRVRHVAHYEWTTYALLAGYPERSKLDPRAWTPSPFYLGLGNTPAERAKAYRDFIDGVLAVPVVELAEAHLAAARGAEVLSEGYGRRLRRPNNTRCG